MCVRKVTFDTANFLDMSSYTVVIVGGWILFVSWADDTFINGIPRDVCLQSHFSDSEKLHSSIVRQ